MIEEVNSSSPREKRIKEIEAEIKFKEELMSRETSRPHLYRAVYEELSLLKIELDILKRNNK